MKHFDMNEVFKGISNPGYKTVGDYLTKTVHNFFKEWLDEMIADNPKYHGIVLPEWDELSEQAKFYWFSVVTTLFAAAHSPTGMLPDNAEAMAKKIVDEEGEQKEKPTATLPDDIDKRVWN